MDSYLSDELAVETNPTVQQHAEQCVACRAEMAARLRLRETMRAAFRSVTLSDEATDRIRARLRAEARVADRARARHSELSPGRLLARLFPSQLPLAVAAGVALVVILASTFLLLRPPSAYASELSLQFLAQAAGDHDHCATQHAHNVAAVSSVDNTQDYDTAFVRLHEAAAPHAAGLTLRAAHVCGFEGRNFVHLVYTRADGQIISLLVGGRDARAMKNARVPNDDGLRAGLQNALQNQYTVSAYQTAKNIVLIVSRLPVAENARVAAQLAQPVSDYVRRIELDQKRMG